mmetsp:Transcript_115150/g.320828  ORF Transcript_115150/g.320828 Transcript_115150/m.320828 type:complete len:330 (+) Transcript_115150:72-1061(+)
MFGAIAGAVGNIAEGLADAAENFLSIPGTEELKEAKDKLGSLVDSLTEPQEMLSKASDATSFPMESIAAAQAQFETLTESLKKMLNGEAKDLLPPGASCAASRYANSIKTKLTAFSSDATMLVERVVQMPDKASGELQGLKSTVDNASGGVGEIASAIQDTAASLKGALTSMDKLKNLGAVVDEIDGKFSSALEKARGSIGEISGLVASQPGIVINMAEELIGDIDKFKMRAPGKITSAFKPPFPCCCCGGSKAAEAQETLESTLASIESSVDLEPLLKGLRDIKKTLEDLDLNPINNALNQVEEQYRATMGPVKEAIEKATQSLPETG